MHSMHVTCHLQGSVGGKVLLSDSEEKSGSHMQQCRTAGWLYLVFNRLLMDVILRFEWQRSLDSNSDDINPWIRMAWRRWLRRSWGQMAASKNPTALLVIYPFRDRISTSQWKCQCKCFEIALFTNRWSYVIRGLAHEPTFSLAYGTMT